MIRKHRIDIRVTEEEKQQISNNAAGNVSNWLRDYGLGNKRKQVEFIQQDPALVSQTLAIGQCLNQITKNMNTKLKSNGFDDIALIELNVHLAQINDAITELVTTDLIKETREIRNSINQISRTMKKEIKSNEFDDTALAEQNSQLLLINKSLKSLVVTDNDGNQL